MPHINLEGYLGHLGLGACLASQLVLPLHSVVCFLLCALVFSFGADSDGLKDEALHFEHVERIILLNCNFVLADIIQELLKERVIRVLKQVVEVLSNDLQQPFIACINGTIVDNRLGCFDHLLDVFKGSRAVLSWFSSLISLDIRIDLLLIYVVDAHRCPIISHYLTLEAKLAVTHRPYKFMPLLACCLFLLSF